MSAVSWREISKYKYLTGEEKLPSNQKLIKEQNKFVYLPLRKPEEDRLKSMEDFFSKDQENNNIKNETDKIKIFERKVLRDELFYEASKIIWF